jgi:Uma2 family endonuclease
MLDRRHHECCDADRRPAPATGPLTVADLDRTPDDGRRYEFTDGTLTVSPAPVLAHQVVLQALEVALESACPDHLAVVPGPGLRMSEVTELIPDLLVVRRAELGRRALTQPPLLAAGVRSPSTALFDLNTKKAVYERFGVPAYWSVVPDPGAPAVVVFELHAGRYEQTGQVTGDEPFHASWPFPVTVSPSALVARLRPA